MRMSDMKRSISAALGLLASFLSVAHAQDAKQILDASGVQGGLVVVIGCESPTRLAQLRAGDSYLVQGLDRDPGNVAAARTYLAERGLYGSITVARLEGSRLPYVDSLVNLIVVTGEAGQISEDEMTRVLAPLGVIADARKERIEITRKPWPAELDEWTHFLHDASNNAVSNDTVVDPPKGLRWTVGPKYARSHEHFASLSAMVTAGGRVFYIIDEGSIGSVFLPPKWNLVARDAFSGVLLWKLPISNWESHLRTFRSGPPEIGRRIVASADRLYVALDYGDPVRVLDAATGEQLATVAGTEGARELLFTGRVLYVLADDMTAGRHEKRRSWIDRTASKLGRPGLEYWYQFPRVAIDMYGVQRIVAVETGAGKQLWARGFEAPGEILPGTFAVDEGRLCLQTLSHMHCLDVANGEELWRSSRPVATSRFSWSSPTLVIQDGVVLSADCGVHNNARRSLPAEGSEWIITGGAGEKKAKGEIVAFSLADGKELWRAPSFENYNVQTDVFVIDGVVWIGNMRHRDDPGFTHGRDLRTGEITATIAGKRETPGMGHHRCYRNKATVRWLLQGRAWLEFLDPKSGDFSSYPWVRGVCQYGIMPANGLIYVPQHSCVCNPSELLAGFNVLSPQSSAGEDPVQLLMGPAYAEAQNLPSGSPETGWPTYRRDAGRSGYQDLPAPGRPEIAWARKLLAPITAPVAANGMVLVAETDRHTVNALSTVDGEPVWAFVADGRIDSPPTLHSGLCLFGTRNGFVYCLRASDGALAWRFRAAPRDRRLFSYEQLESVWPVHGSVLVDETLSDGVATAYFAAGRSSRIDGGIHLYALEARTGAVLRTADVNMSDEAQGEGIINTKSLPDILSCQKGAIWMRHLGVDKNLVPVKKVPHLFAPRGFLDDTWWHRTYSFYDTDMGWGYQNFPIVSNMSPAGRLLAFNGEEFYGYGRLGYRISPIGHPEVGHIGGDARNMLFSEELAPRPAEGTWKNWTPATMKGLKRFPWSRKIQWSRELPFVPRSIVLARDALLVAGGESLDESAESHGPGTFWVASREDGSRKVACTLPAPPVLDGMALTDSGVFVSMVDGSVAGLRSSEASAEGGQAENPNLPSADGTPATPSPKETTTEVPVQPPAAPKTVTRPTSSSSPTNRPNVVVLLSDDLGSQDIGCYGGPVETPPARNHHQAGRTRNTCTDGPGFQ